MFYEQDKNKNKNKKKNMIKQKLKYKVECYFYIIDIVHNVQITSSFGYLFKA